MVDRMPMDHEVLGSLAEFMSKMRYQETPDGYRIASIRLAPVDDGDDLPVIELRHVDIDDDQFGKFVLDVPDGDDERSP